MMSNVMNVVLCLLGVPLYQSITLAVIFHKLCLVCSIVLSTNVLNIVLLITPISDLLVLISKTMKSNNQQPTTNNQQPTNKIPTNQQTTQTEEQPEA